MVAKTKKASEIAGSQRQQSPCVAPEDSALQSFLHESSQRFFLILCYAHFCHIVYPSSSLFIDGCSWVFLRGVRAFSSCGSVLLAEGSGAGLSSCGAQA